MTEFERNVEHYCKDLDSVSVGCLGEHCEYADDDDDPNHQCEAYFSRNQCNSCGSTLGGNRLPGFGMFRADKTADIRIIAMELCVDCVMFHANGELPE